MAEKSLSSSPQNRVEEKAEVPLSPRRRKNRRTETFFLLTITLKQNVSDYSLSLSCSSCRLVKSLKIKLVILFTAVVLFRSLHGRTTRTGVVEQCISSLL